MMPRLRAVLCLILLAGFCLGESVPSKKPFQFPTGKHGKGELRYINGIPVLIVQGMPQEIGEQMAILAGKPSERAITYPKDVLSYLATPVGLKLVWPIVVKNGNRLLQHFPADHRQEFEALVKASGLDRELLVAANTMFDLKQDLAALFGCSALIVDGPRSATGRPIFGRNMDYISLGYLHEYSLVTVYRPRGKHAFVSIGFPALVGTISGMNDAGLALAVLETTGAEPGEGPVFNPEGVPFALCYRRLLEECATVQEAERVLRSMKRTTANNLAICDKTGGAVFEITPSRVVVRHTKDSIAVCTNHFCSDELKLSRPRDLFTTFERFRTLDKARKEPKQLGIGDVQRYLDAANQGDLTLQTMIFEPATLTLHLAFAVDRRPASSRELKRLELAPLLKSKKGGEQR
jgi:isopenicillin-N N-acyltransferase-like protein